MFRGGSSHALQGQFRISLDALRARESRGTSACYRIADPAVYQRHLEARAALLPAAAKPRATR